MNTYTPIEERKIRKANSYMKQCRRCRSIYYTLSKNSKICDDCKLPCCKGMIRFNCIKKEEKSMLMGA